MAKGGGRGGSSGRGGYSGASVRSTSARLSSGRSAVGSGKSNRGPSRYSSNISGPAAKNGILKSMIEAINTLKSSGSAFTRAGSAAARTAGPKASAKVPKVKQPAIKPKQNRPVDRRGMQNRNKPLTAAQITQRQKIAEKVYADDVLTLRQEMYDEIWAWYNDMVSEIYEDIEDGESDYDQDEDKSVDDYLIEAWDDLKGALQEADDDISDLFKEAMDYFMHL